MRELSRVAGASPAVVYQIERGLIAKPSAEIAIQLARALGTTPEYLILGEGEAPGFEQIEAAFRTALAAAGPTETLATGTDEG